MPQVPDSLESVPLRRVSVARGTLSMTGVEPPNAEQAVTARVAAIQAAKHAAQTIPTLAQVALSGCDCDLAIEDGQVHATVTVQAYSRVTLEMFALAGVAAGLLSVWDQCASGKGSGKGLAITDLQVVQNVVL